MIESDEEQWRKLAREASKEKDNEKMLDLIEQIVEKYLEAKQRKSPTSLKR